MKVSRALFSQITRLTREPFIDVAQTGVELLNNPSLNKGSAFSKEERRIFRMQGLLPTRVNTLEEQIDRAYKQFHMTETDLLKNVFCESLRVQNQVLYFALVRKYLKEMMRIIYTPTQGDYIAHYSQLFRKPRGCYLDINKGDHRDIAVRLAHHGDSEDIDYIVVTDAEGILGIGDQGVGGIGISLAKLELMTACGGIHPDRVIPVVVDCGTNNEGLLKDPLYMGNRHHRVTGAAYDQFFERFMDIVKERYPNAVVHFEDFGTANAYRLLDKYREELPCFNDDIQGTGAVTMAALKGALHSTGGDLHTSKVLIFGAGSAGMGIANQLVGLLKTQGIASQDARKNVYLMDRYGLITTSIEEKTMKSQQKFMKPADEWEGVDTTSLVEVIRHIKPDVLIGCSTQAGAFTKEAVQEMASHVKRPVILPLSNPTRLHEAVPKDLIKWTDGRVLVATGSPFPPVNGREISENNNCFVFPGIGLGAVLARASRISHGMIAAAVDQLAALSPVLQDPEGPLLPDIRHINDISARVATAVVLRAKAEGLARVSNIAGEAGDHDFVEIPDDYDEAYIWVRSQMWEPEYRRYRRARGTTLPQ